MKIRRMKIHRKISEDTDGMIPFGYHVHHCDFNHKNNAPDNLVQIPEELHVAIHKHYLYKPSKKEILEKILPEFERNKKPFPHRDRDEIVRDLAILARRVHAHPDRDYILKRTRRLFTVRKHLLKKS